MNKDYLDILAEFLAETVEFLLVGAYALAVYGHPRATGDIDLWVRCSPENARKILKALARFGAPVQDLTPADFESPKIAYQIGLAPNQIDILTQIDGVVFDEAWINRVEAEVESLRVPVISRQDFIKNKRSTGRHMDLGDVSRLEEEEPTAFYPSP